MGNLKAMEMMLKFIKKDQDGFTLLETMVALLILLAALGGMVPLFVTHRLAAIDNQIETGANSIAQRVMDELRQTDWDDIKDLSGDQTTLPSGNIDSTFMGKDYDVTITYCPVDIDPGLALTCNLDDNTQFIRVAVEYNDQDVFQVETIYTNLE